MDKNVNCYDIFSCKNWKFHWWRFQPNSSMSTSFFFIWMIYWQDLFVLALIMGRGWRNLWYLVGTASMIIFGCQPLGGAALVTGQRQIFLLHCFRRFPFFETFAICSAVQVLCKLVQVCALLCILVLLDCSNGTFKQWLLSVNCENDFQRV